MVRVVRTPQCISEFLREQEPFFVGEVSVPRDKKEREPEETKVVMPPLPKPATKVNVGIVLDSTTNFNH